MTQAGILVTHEGQKTILTVRNPNVVPEGIAQVTNVVLRPMGLREIPPWISSIALLTELQVNGNPLERLAEIPNRLSKLEARNCKIREPLVNLPESLTYLDVNSNQLSDPGIFEKLPATLRTLILTDNGIPLLPKRFPLRILTHLSLDFNRLTSLPSGLPNTLQHLSVTGNQLTELPERLPLSLRVLRADFNQISELSLKMLTRCEELLTLEMSDNCIRTLEAGFLPPKIQVVKLARNGLRLSEALIIPSSLQLLDLSNNNLDDVGFLKFSGGVLPPLSFLADRVPYYPRQVGVTITRARGGLQSDQEVPQYEGLILVLSCNPAITYIPPGVLPRNLTQLDVDCCGLHELPSDMRFTALEFLSAEMNHITTLRVDDLPSSLISLILTKNYISRIVERTPYASWHRLINLKNISLRGNLLESLPRSWLIEMTQLRSLDVAENAMKTFPLSLPAGLNDLILSDNLLRDLGQDPLPSNLKRLQVERNLLTSITGPALLGTTRHLTSLMIGENSVRYVSPEVRSHLETIFHDEEDTEWGGIRRHRVFDHFPVGNVYTDPQIVHRHEVQESIRESIEKLLRDGELDAALHLDEVTRQLIESKISHQSVRNMLLCAGMIDISLIPTIRNSELIDLILPVEKRPVIREQISLGQSLIDFADVLRMTWSLIQRHPERATIVDNLEKELTQEVPPCITGLVDSLVGSLAVFDERVTVRISTADQLAAVIEATGRLVEKQGGYTTEEHRRVATAELLERGFGLAEIEIWVSEIG